MSSIFKKSRAWVIAQSGLVTRALLSTVVSPQKTLVGCASFGSMALHNGVVVDESASRKAGGVNWNRWNQPNPSSPSVGILNSAIVMPGQSAVNRSSQRESSNTFAMPQVMGSDNDWAQGAQRHTPFTQKSSHPEDCDTQTGLHRVITASVTHAFGSISCQGPGEKLAA